VACTPYIDARAIENFQDKKENTILSIQYLIVGHKTLEKNDTVLTVKRIEMNRRK
jgi:hypothetical protein